MSVRYKNFIRDYLTDNNGKMDSEFIKSYLGIGAIIEYFIFRANGRNPDFIENVDIMDRVNKIQNAYMNGVEGQDVRDCDFSALTQEEFEMIRFDEDTKFNEETIAKFHTDEITKRKNTQIPNELSSERTIHIAILDEPIIQSEDSQNLIVNNYAHENTPVEDSHHGRTAYSIFNSINPNCIVHFYGTDSEYTEDRIKALQDIIEYNDKCTDDSEKIKLVSCSHKLSKGEKELIASGKINAISADNFHNGNFFEYFKFDNTEVVPRLTKEEKEYLIAKYSQYPGATKLIEMMDSLMDNAILMNSNLVIDQPNSSIRRHECNISISWGVPVVAAYFSRALEINPNMDYEEFYAICQNSLKEGTKIFDEKLFMENVKKIEQEKSTNSQEKRRSLADDYKDAIEGSDLSYRLGSIDEATKKIKSDIVRAEEKQPNNDVHNIE